MHPMNKTVATISITALLVSAAACTSPGEESARKESKTAASQLDQFLQSQPVPVFSSSQLRQNLIEIETAQANTTATTSFMFLLAGVGSSGPLVHSCPSIGFPIPATYQLTNPLQPYGDTGANGGGVTIGQLESTGVYTGDTTGTYVMCIDPNGKPYALYHEGYVSTVTGPAHWDTAKGEIILDGPSSAPFTQVTP
jgi:hypothetical protein